MMMKILALLLVLAMTLSLAACGGSIPVSNDTTAEPAVTAATVQWLGNLK